MSEATTALRESASHEAGHVLLCLTLDGPRLEFARAATSGRGTSRLLNAKELPPRTAAQVAVAGRVSEEVLLDLPARPVPDNDGFLLSWALDQLGDEAGEVEVRAEVERMLRADRTALQAIADELAANPDADVPLAALADVVARARV